MDNKNIINLLAATAIQQKAIKELADSEGLHLCGVDANTVHLLFKGFRKLFNKEDCTCHDHDEAHVRWTIQIDGVTFLALENKDNEGGWYKRKKKSDTKKVMEQTEIKNHVDLITNPIAIPMTNEGFRDRVFTWTGTLKESNEEVGVLEDSNSNLIYLVYANCSELVYTAIKEHPDRPFDKEAPYTWLDNEIEFHS